MPSISPICKGCGQQIWGNYIHALDTTWHPEHFVCAGCGQPVGSARFLLHEGAPYHTECYSRLVAPHCVYCGKPLLHEYLIDQWGSRFCQEHQDHYPACASCGRLVPPDQQEQGAERVRCPICRATAIESTVEAKPLFSQVIRWIGSQGLSYQNLHINLELCGRARLAELLQEQGQSHSLGATTSATYTQNGHVVRTEVNGIAVLQGLPATLFQGVTVHELGHVWLIVQNILGLPVWSEEGFCELLSHRFYQHLDTPESRYHASSIEQNPDSTYGEGFRRIRTLADAHGFAQFVEHLRSTKHLPR